MSTEALSEQDFERIADASLHALDAALGELDGLEVDFQMGIITLEFTDGVKYIINSHRAARQIWMAAERNAWHFDYQPAEKRWVAPKSGDELWATVQAVTSRKLGRPVELAR